MGKYNICTNCFGASWYNLLEILQEYEEFKYH
jgi:hypothetical protein